MKKGTTRLVLVSSLAMTGLGGAKIAHAGEVCWTNGIHVNHLLEGTLCQPVDAPVDAAVRTAPSIVTVEGSVNGTGVGTTGAGYSLAPVGPRVWVDGREQGLPSVPPNGTVCWTNGVNVNHLGEGTLCEPVPGVNATVKTQMTAATVSVGVVNGPSVGETGVVWGGAPNVRVLVDGNDVP